jgi:hypothetical protein
MVKLLGRDDVARCAATLEVPEAAMRAVVAVEAAGSGYVRGTELPKILFEGHIFSRLTGGAFDDERPDLSYPKWTKRHYKGGRGEYDRLLAAIELEADAALKSASWGLGQVMGFNHEVCGFADIDDFVNAMAASEGEQLMAMARFIKANGLADELRRHDWAGFARGYNGPGYRANAYDTKLAAAFARARLGDDGDRGLPFVEDRARVAELQAALNAAIDAALAVDGWWGPNTRGAMRPFQAARGLDPTDAPDAVTLDALGLGDA